MLHMAQAILPQAGMMVSGISPKKLLSDPCDPSGTLTRAPECT